jgi:hypothetical protein
MAAYDGENLLILGNDLKRTRGRVVILDDVGQL